MRTNTMCEYATNPTGAIADHHHRWLRCTHCSGGTR